jgi:hypothetical protein
MTGAPSNHSLAFLLKFWKGSPATWASKADLLVYCFVILRLVYERERRHGMEVRHQRSEVGFCMARDCDCARVRRAIGKSTLK